MIKEKIKQLKNIRRIRRDAKIRSRTRTECYQISRIKFKEQKSKLQYNHNLEIVLKNEEVSDLKKHIKKLEDEKRKSKKTRIELEVRSENMERLIAKLRDNYQATFGKALGEIDSNFILIEHNKKKEA